MSNTKKYALYNAFPSGVLIILLATFFAGGAIGENYTDRTYPNPLVLLAKPIWFLCYLFANVEKFFGVGIVLMYSLPILSIFVFLYLS
ncbi:hypothetical protein [Alkalicoccobacillus murimartini]|uniref:Uncharacterized protein n=1 Tax=Alkalicoccobacillus murimartini TaxID=171685 RepID=A0ABT9YM42_9BACI|nr:hypothetical protein [Alkalicoccobacillus murimartini]MDQ0208663.1 hypothetical protein [Alkalicoccobacillus murimartini]